MSQDTSPTYRVLAHDIKNLGVDCVFGLMSDDTAMFATELDVIGVDFHGARHENSAIAMAEGYAAASGHICLLYTSDAADERSSVDLGGRRIIKK